MFDLSAHLGLLSADVYLVVSKQAKEEKNEKAIKNTIHNKQ